MSTTEEWRPISGFGNGYEVSSFGRVRSLSRMVNRQGRPLSVPGKLLKEGIGPNGYPLVNLWFKNRGKSIYIHSLVLAAFCEKPNGAETCNHKNYVRSDNRIENLEWVTYRQNNLHSYKSGHHRNLKENRYGN